MKYTADSYRSLTPYLQVANADAELAFLGQAFDALELEVNRGPDGRLRHAELRIGNSLLMIGEASNQWPAHHGACFLWVSDVDATHARAVGAGATSILEPADQDYGHRTAGVRDVNGQTWWISSPAG